MPLRKINLSDILTFLLALFALFLGISTLIGGKVFNGLFWLLIAFVIVAQRIRNMQGKTETDKTGKKLTTVENILVTIVFVPIAILFLFLTIYLVITIKQPFDAIFPLITGVLSAATGIAIYRQWARLKK